MPETVKIDVSTCYHCGDPCESTVIFAEDKSFCCEGCKLVYEILEENEMCTYYDLDSNPGVSLKSKNFGERYTFLSNKDIAQQLLDYASDSLCKLTLYIPSIHCSSCIWLLENLHRLREGITTSRVNFVKKEVAISYDPSVISLQQVAELLATIGYAPDISLENYNRSSRTKTGNSIFLKLGITGFCTGNIMLLSFPEYFGLDEVVDAQYRSLFIWMNAILSLPVFFYGASDYLISAWQSLRKNLINIDVPLSIGIVALFGRSLYETISGTGAGYWDSMTGLVFFLLIGKWLQNKTFENLSFDRNYKSYFPLAATIIKQGQQATVPVTELTMGDHIVIRNQELIPADSTLLSEKAWLDYSFVTGESEPVEKKCGDYIYAGGRQTGASIELSVEKPVSQSYLTQLWNNEAFAKEKLTPVTALANDFSRYFTYATLSIAAMAATFWYFNDPSVMWNALTAVLIVACPCALSLSMPFAMENTMRIFGRTGFYVKNTGIIQHLANITHIIFDKTGTLTQSSKSQILYTGKPLTKEDHQIIKSLTANSTHPLSRKLFHFLENEIPAKVKAFQEITGAGIEGIVLGKHIRIGSVGFIGRQTPTGVSSEISTVHVLIDHEYKGSFSFSNPYRSGLQKVMTNLKKRFKLSLLSGDRKVDVLVLLPFFGKKNQLNFEQSPTDKLNYVKHLQTKGEKVLMIGDGLNDAGALKQSDVGMVLTEDVHAFFPACDILADARKLDRLHDIIRFSRTSVNVVKLSFLLSMVYNVIGLAWAVSGNLSPVFAAILMPVSSISVVAFAVGATSLWAKWRKL